MIGRRVTEKWWWDLFTLRSDGLRQSMIGRRVTEKWWWDLFTLCSDGLRQSMIDRRVTEKCWWDLFTLCSDGLRQSSLISLLLSTFLCHPFCDVLTYEVVHFMVHPVDLCLCVLLYFSRITDAGSTASSDIQHSDSEGNCQQRFDFVLSVLSQFSSAVYSAKVVSTDLYYLLFRCCTTYSKCTFIMSPPTSLLIYLQSLLSSSCSAVNPMVTMRLKYDVSILVCHVWCPSLPSCSVVNNSSPLVYYWSTSCTDDLCCVFPVYSNVVLWLAVCPRTFLIRGQTTWDVFLSLRLLSRVGLLFFWFLHSLWIITPKKIFPALGVHCGAPSVPLATPMLGTILHVVFDQKWIWTTARRPGTIRNAKFQHSRATHGKFNRFSPPVLGLQ